MGKEKVIVREIDHTADYGVRVTASHLSLLFEKMAEILSSAMVDLSGVADNRKKTLSFKENDLESLMMSWLSELLFLFEVKNLIFKKFKCKLNNFSLKAEMWGDTFNQKKHHRRMNVKAITYHTFYVKKKSRGFEAQVIFDV